MSEQDELLQDIALIIRQNTKPYESLRDGRTIQAEEIAQVILAKAKQYYEQKIGEALKDFSDIQREEGHPKSYWAGYHYARSLVMSALEMEQKRLDRPDREKIAKILEDYGAKIRDIVETPDTTLVMVVAKAIEARNKTTDQILALIPDIEAIDELRTRLTELERKLDDREEDLIEAEKREKERTLQEVEALFADKTGVSTFIRKRDGRAGVEDCWLIITSEWQRFRKGDPNEALKNE